MLWLFWILYIPTQRSGVKMLMNTGMSTPLMEVKLTFRPERMLNGGFKNLPPDSWKPFGNGVRGCIGRQFAMQEVLLLVAMVRSIFLSYNHADVQIFQSFDIRPHNPDYKLQIKHTITLKPRDFYMHASPRKGRDIRNIPTDLLERWISVSFTVSLCTFDVDVS
jgi:hypothetical protein